MPTSLLALLITLGSILRSRLDLQLEILALRHQIGVLERSVHKGPRLTPPVVSSGSRFTASGATGVRRCSSSSRKRLWPGIAGFRLFWSWKVRHGQEGRPAISRQTRDLIRRMCRENPTWGAPRIHGELLKLGFDIGESSVSKYMVRVRKPPSQTWRTFLENHLSQIVSVDFLPFPPSVSRSCTCSWCWLMIAVE